MGGQARHKKLLHKWIRGQWYRVIDSYFSNVEGLVYNILILCCVGLLRQLHVIWSIWFIVSTFSAVFCYGKVNQVHKKHNPSEMAAEFYAAPYCQIHKKVLQCRTCFSKFRQLNWSLKLMSSTKMGISKVLKFIQ